VTPSILCSVDEEAWQRYKKKENSKINGGERISFFLFELQRNPTLAKAVHLFFFCYYYIWHLLDLSFLYRVRQRMKRRSPYRRFDHITLLIVDQMGKFPRKQLLHT